MIAGITAAVSLSAAAGAVGALGILGAFVLVRYVPRYIEKPSPRGPRDEREDLAQ